MAGYSMLSQIAHLLLASTVPSVLSQYKFFRSLTPYSALHLSWIASWVVHAGSSREKSVDELISEEMSPDWRGASF